ncbi:MAG TPA: NAD(P)(+) transhydrogenase (Re/Si-specific) subunit beta [Steroidobacteraceae bacterium]|nr:NAD(P)(+) transhydrogenase (Re/Si-specific) subunit beta [Steroidobacteraceae bacterium]
MQASYVVAALLFIFGLKRLSSPATARSGNRIAALGMAVALSATLLDRGIVNWWGIIGGTIVGAAIGIYFGRTVAMTSMPQMVALFNGMGGATAAIVSVVEFTRAAHAGPGVKAAAVLGAAIGALSLTGSIVAFGKLQELLSGKPMLFTGQKFVNALIALGILGLGAMVVIGRGDVSHVWILTGLALLLGVLFVLPIGGGDMPVIISILNSLTGLAAALTGLALGNQLLVVAGILVGSSGTLLTLLMSKAMNRNISNVLFAGFGTPVASAAATSASGLTVRETSADDAAVAMAYANKVVIVPGYGLAVAEAQHASRELATELEKRGVDVKYAIHPVAGRMPGHMNVLLAEAEVPYDQLAEMDEINPQFEQTDVVLVVGANDVVNPAARSDTSSPIYGMPILDVDKARNVIVLKRSMNPGFAGIENELFYRGNTRMLFGDARKSLAALIEAVRAS